MASEDSATYHHTQRGPLCLFLYGAGVGLLILTWVLRHFEPVVLTTCLFCGLWLIFWAGCHHRLTIWDDGDRLAIRYGPVPWPPRKPWWLLYQDIHGVEAGKTTRLESWGMQGFMTKGFIINIWGDSCVTIRLKNGSIRLGSDDAMNLTRFLESKICSQRERANLTDAGEFG